MFHISLRQKVPSFDSPVCGIIYVSRILTTVGGIRLFLLAAFFTHDKIFLL
uniref:Uncharacterized protein n=1 Tax=Siphoviridae sp. ctSwt2 TaxID=2826346 RepID=A0A8S5QY82_9CAUD|nr:MAG TPA: hypothetical protein [Siphoviridae sp. ctSwt2]